MGAPGVARVGARASPDRDCPPHGRRHRPGETRGSHLCLSLSQLDNSATAAHPEQPVSLGREKSMTNGRRDRRGRCYWVMARDRHRGARLRYAAALQSAERTAPSMQRLNLAWGWRIGGEGLPPSWGHRIGAAGVTWPGRRYERIVEVPLEPAELTFLSTRAMLRPISSPRLVARRKDRMRGVGEASAWARAPASVGEPNRQPHQRKCGHVPKSLSCPRCLRAAGVQQRFGAANSAPAALSVTSFIEGTASERVVCSRESSIAPCSSRGR
jgi:hypothetical protein